MAPAQAQFDSPAAAGGMPPLDPGSDDSDQDDHPLHEPQFEIHVVDDGRRHRRPPPLLPIQHRRPPPSSPRLLVDYDDSDEDVEERLHNSMILPQGLLCGWTFLLGIGMIYVASNPQLQAEIDWPIFVIVCSALLMLFALLSLLLSIRGVYGGPGLNKSLRR